MFLVPVNIPLFGISPIKKEFHFDPCKYTTFLLLVLAVLVSQFRPCKKIYFNPCKYNLLPLVLAVLV